MAQCLRQRRRTDDGAPKAPPFHAQLGRQQQGRHHCERSLALCRQYGNWHGESAALDSLAYIARRSGDHELALTYYSDALALCRKSGNTNDEAEILASLGDTYAALDRRIEARRSWCLAVDLLRAQAQEAGHLLRKTQLLERTSD